MKSLYAEIRRRKVGRVLIAYAAAAFVVLQVAELTLEPVGAPAWVMTVLVLLAGLGFPIAFVLAWAFDITPEGIQTTPASSAGDVAAPRSGRRLLFAGVLTAVVLGAGGAAAYMWTAGGRSDLDPQLVAVLPFRVSGHPTAEYLEEGMVDLLATTLNGDVGPRAADPRAVLAAWRRVSPDGGVDLPAESAAQVARTVGAGRMLLGSVVAQTSDRIQISARLARVDGGNAVDAAVAGPADSLPALVDQLTAQLLSLDAGFAVNRLAGMTSRSLPAVRSYLVGQSLYRASRFEEAAHAFDAALDADSMFALAALGLRMTTGWSTGTLVIRNGERMTRLLAANIDRLNGSDASIARAFIGAYPRTRTVRQALQAWETATREAAERPESWFMYGDVMLHYGAAAGITDNQQIAATAFERSLAIDSTFTPAATHLVDAALVSGDSAAFRRYSAMVGSDPRAAEYQWAMRTIRGGGLRGADLHAMFDTLSSGDLHAVAFYFFATEDMATEDALYATRRLREQALTGPERSLAYSVSSDVSLSLGRPVEAAGYGRRLLAVTSDTSDAAMSAVVAAIVAGGDTAFASEAARALDRIVDRPPNRFSRVQSACGAAAWRAWANSPSDRYRAVLTSEAEDSSNTGVTAATCVAALDGIRALQSGSGVDAAAGGIERIVAPGTYGDYQTVRLANWVAARLHEARGDRAAALAAISRDYILPTSLYALTARLSEEARLAAAAGENERAVELYTKLLRYFAAAEPSFQPQVERIRQDLARLTGDARRAN